MKIYQTGLIALGLVGLVGCHSGKQPGMPNVLPFSAPLTPMMSSSDAATNNAVNHVLMTNKKLAPFHIDVQTINGAVILNGYVKTIRQSDIAGEVASKVPGVKSVQNNIIVRK